MPDFNTLLLVSSWNMVKENYRRVSKIISLSMAMIVFFIFFSSTVKAGACRVTDGSGVANGQVSVTGVFNMPEDDSVGNIKDIDISQSTTVDKKPAICSCNGGSSTSLWDWTRFNVPTEEMGGITYGIISDYLEVAILAGDTQDQQWIPYENHEHAGSADICDRDTVTGGGGSIARIRLRRKIVGEVPLGNTLVYTKGSNTFSSDSERVPEIQYFFSGFISVPQSCELDGGETIDLNFGKISASLFSQAGAGNKPDGVMPQTANISIKCKNIDAQTALTLRIQGENVSGNMMVSDNKDVGFILTDDKNNPLTPDDFNSLIHFVLDENALANVTISAYPVSVTGNKPAEGNFTAQGYLRVDFE